MEYIHVRNLEKYHPGYKDRTLQWAKIYFNAVAGDVECEMLHEIDWSRFIKMILLELRGQKPLPNKESFWRKQGFNLKNRSMSMTLGALQNFIVVCNKDEIATVESRYVDKEQEQDKEEDCKRKTLDTEEVSPFLRIWNEKMPWKINGITSSRRKLLNDRVREPLFVEKYSEVLDKVLASDFLSGKKTSPTHPHFKADFDWVIANDQNYVRILEGKYDNREGDDHEALRKQFGFKTEAKGVR